MTWSRTPRPRSVPASTSRRVSTRSSTVGGRVAARVVVRREDRGRVREKRCFEHFARMDECGVEDAAAHLVLGEEPQLRREAEQPEDLDGLHAQQVPLLSAFLDDGLLAGKGWRGPGRS
jgi:hypothetical protein